MIYLFCSCGWRRRRARCGAAPSASWYSLSATLTMRWSSTLTPTWRTARSERRQPAVCTHLHCLLVDVVRSRCQGKRRITSVEFNVVQEESVLNFSAGTTELPGSRSFVHESVHTVADGSLASRRPLTSQKSPLWVSKESQRCSRRVRQQRSGVRMAFSVFIKYDQGESRNGHYSHHLALNSAHLLGHLCPTKYYRIRICGRVQCSKCQWVTWDDDGLTCFVFLKAEVGRDDTVRDVQLMIQPGSIYFSENQEAWKHSSLTCDQNWLFKKKKGGWGVSGDDCFYTDVQCPG